MKWPWEFIRYRPLAWWTFMWTIWCTALGAFSIITFTYTAGIMFTLLSLAFLIVYKGQCDRERNDGF